MNKLLSAIVILAVLLTLPVAALAEDYDDALDAAFDAGSLAFAHADFPLPDPETCEIVMPPDALWQFIGIEPMDEAQIRAVVRELVPSYRTGEEQAAQKAAACKCETVGAVGGTRGAAIAMMR